MQVEKSRHSLLEYKKLDLSIWTGGLNMDREYTGSGEIRVGYISILQVSDQPNGFIAPFFGLFIFLSK